jgi:hypothetical protein
MEHAAYHSSNYIDLFPSAIVIYLRKYYKNTRMEDWDDQWAGEMFKTCFLQNGYCTFSLFMDSTAGMGKKNIKLVFDKMNRRPRTDRPIHAGTQIDQNQIPEMTLRQTESIIEHLESSLTFNITLPHYSMLKLYKRRNNLLGMEPIALPNRTINESDESMTDQYGNINIDTSGTDSRDTSNEHMECTSYYESDEDDRNLQQLHQMDEEQVTYRNAGATLDQMDIISPISDDEMY